MFLYYQLSSLNELRHESWLCCSTNNPDSRHKDKDISNTLTLSLNILLLTENSQSKALRQYLITIPNYAASEFSITMTVDS